jgi:hypothetical protein
MQPSIFLFRLSLIADSVLALDPRPSSALLMLLNCVFPKLPGARIMHCMFPRDDVVTLYSLIKEVCI